MMKIAINRNLDSNQTDSSPILPFPPLVEQYLLFIFYSYQRPALLKIRKEIILYICESQIFYFIFNLLLHSCAPLWYLSAVGIRGFL